MDSIVHFENERYVGRTNFRGGLLNSLVLLAVKDVDGVHRMSHWDYKFRRAFNKNLWYGVRTKHDHDGINIDVSIWIKFGYQAADVSYRVQENIINTISNLIERKIKQVNVRINGVAKV
jgi:uncharacterized alkaline shock family protein YloU